MARGGWPRACLAAAPLALLAATFCTSPAAADFIVETNALRVNFPVGIRGSYAASIGNFGSVFYGGSMSGQAFYPGVNSRHETDSPWACEKFHYGADTFPEPHTGLARIAIVDRGDCYFVEKVYYAQQAGAMAVIVADDVERDTLVTMDTPDDDPRDPTQDLVRMAANITVPSVLVLKSTGDAMKDALRDGKDVLLTLDWTDSVPHPDSRVEWELWSNSNDACGAKCDAQKAFVREFAGIAKVLEKGGYTQFTPHYITWFCPEEYRDSEECMSECIGGGRYCAPDPDDDLSSGYEGKDVVTENLRQLCVFRQANATGEPWLWWSYVTQFGVLCTMEDSSYDEECAERVLSNLSPDWDVQATRDCVGHPAHDAPIAILDAEQAAQEGDPATGRGDVTILPTVVLNNVQYRGSLTKSAVLRALCAGFPDRAAPEICSTGSQGGESAGAGAVNECRNNHGGCWHLEVPGVANFSACKDTVDSYTCECPEHFVGDGQSCHPADECASMQMCSCSRCACENVPGGPLNPAFCTLEPAHCTAAQSFQGCFADPEHGVHANMTCHDVDRVGSSPPTHRCECPAGYEGDGVTCHDRCDNRDTCACKHCQCRAGPITMENPFKCGCKKGYYRPEGISPGEEGSCVRIPGGGSGTDFASVVGIVGASVFLAAAGGFAFYRFKLRREMDGEIRSIMSQYMPLDRNGNMVDNGPTQFGLDDDDDDDTHPSVSAL